jgi:hypothetical protein
MNESERDRQPRRKRTIIASSPLTKLDRDGDIVTATGWKLDNYLKNPVVLYATTTIAPLKAESSYRPAARHSSSRAFPAIRYFPRRASSTLFVDSVYNLANLLLNAVSVASWNKSTDP